MSKETLWDGLRRRGLSEEVTAAVMGNMQAESAFRSNNVEDRCSTPDAQYTAMVDSGSYGKQQFMYDTYGYGLCQWTYFSRKAALYDFAKQKMKSIGDEEMQLDFFFTEGEWKSIASTMNTLSVEEGAKLFMVKHENPADKSTSAQNYRASIARAIYNEMKGRPANGQQVNFPSNTGVSSPVYASPANEQSTESCEITVRVLRKGDKGRDVFMAQCGLNDASYTCGVADGDFGTMSEFAVNRLKAAYGLPQDGICDEDVWQILFQ